MDHITRLSELVYVGLCYKIGSPTEMRIRREVMDIEEFLNKPLYIMRGYDRMKSGSTREGFRLKTSDIDFMFWPSDHKVICDLCQISIYRIPEQTVILMECDNLPPGFARLKPLSPLNCAKIMISCVFVADGLCISSSLFRKNYMHNYISRVAPATFSVCQGPCLKFIDQGLEADFVFCVRSRHWPTIALPWIQRCRQQGWPSDSVVSEILSGGCHVVPIGSRPDRTEEWRVSFSRAEQRIVSSMNHCQFLCYGLFKVFLKEVINFKNNAPILCSYFIKSCLFWVIQNDSLNWTPSHILFRFWECYRLMMYWVYTGECPIFFIPQNNMFRVKVTGSVQVSLFRQLHELYDKGISCLLLSETLRPFLNKFILYRTLKVCTDESSVISSTVLDVSFFSELQTYIYILSIEECLIYTEHLKRIVTANLTSYQIVTLQYMTSCILRNIAFFIQNRIPPKQYGNKVYYKASKVSFFLKLSCTFGCVSEILYLALYLHRDCRYEKSLSCLQKAQERMSQPYTMCNDINEDMYGQCMAGIPLGQKLRRAVIKMIMLNNDYTYVTELVMEQRISKKLGMNALFIQPLVMLHMLFILNHHRLGDIVRSQQSVQDLQTLLHDPGDGVNVKLRDISWQILGICQQICGDYLGSLESYQCSLQQIPYHKIQEVTMLRINTLTLREV